MQFSLQIHTHWRRSQSLKHRSNTRFSCDLARKTHIWIRRYTHRHKQCTESHLGFHGHMFFFSLLFFLFSENIPLKYSTRLSTTKKRNKDFFSMSGRVGSSSSLSTWSVSSFIVHIRIVFDTAQHHFKSLTLVLTEITFVDVLYYVFLPLCFLSEEQFLASRQVHSVFASWNRLYLTAECFRFAGIYWCTD